jgi:plasmid stabilization system protein ParE
MSREVIWLPDAITDLIRLRKFIQDKNPSAAKRAASKIKEGALTLMSNPESGRPVEGLSSFREILIPFGAGNYVYVIEKMTLQSLLSGFGTVKKNVLKF